MSEYKVIKDCRHCDEANPAIMFRIGLKSLRKNGCKNFNKSESEPK